MIKQYECLIKGTRMKERTWITSTWLWFWQVNCSRPRGLQPQPDCSWRWLRKCFKLCGTKSVQISSYLSRSCGCQVEYFTFLPSPSSRKLALKMPIFIMQALGELAQANRPSFDVKPLLTGACLGVLWSWFWLGPLVATRWLVGRHWYAIPG